MSDTNLNNNIDSSVTELRELLYLDRPRLTSYIAQIYDGLTTRRDLQSVVMKGDVETTKQEENSHTATITGSSELKIPLIAGIDMSTNVEKSHKVSTGGDYLIRLEKSIFGESKIDQDNLFILFEKYINEKNLVNDYELNNNYSGFIYVNGLLQIEDRKQVDEILSKLDLWIKAGLLDENEMKDSKKQAQKMLAMSKALQAFKLDNLIAHIIVDTFTASAVINPLHLTLSLEQLHSLYSFHLTEVTVLGVPLTNQGQRRKLGAFGNFDFTSLANVLNSSTDLHIFPIAIYRTIK